MNLPPLTFFLAWMAFVLSAAQPIPCKIIWRHPNPANTNLSFNVRSTTNILDNGSAWILWDIVTNTAATNVLIVAPEASYAMVTSSNRITGIEQPDPGLIPIMRTFSPWTHPWTFAALVGCSGDLQPCYT